MAKLFDINLLIENSGNSDASILSNTIVCSSNSVNSYMIQGGHLNCRVPAGGQSEDTMSFNIEELVLHNITSVAELELACIVHQIRNFCKFDCLFTDFFS